LREVKKRSVVPVYGFAAVWLLYCLLFPLYRLWHFAVLAGVSMAVYFILRAVFPGTVEYVEEEPEPVTTGNEEIDALLREGDAAVSELKRLRGSIKNESVRSKVDELIGLTDRIFKDVVEDPSDYKQVRRFADYFLPTTLKLLNAYDRFDGMGELGENTSGTVRRIEDILDTTVEAYRKELDALFANQALDIETDISVLEAMMKKEGLSGEDF